MDVQQRIADVIAAHELSYSLGTCRCQKWQLGMTHAGHVAEAIMSDLAEETRWVPVTESGERWAPREREYAEAAWREYPAGGCYQDGSNDPDDGITHIEREVRWASRWMVVEVVYSVDQ